MPNVLPHSKAEPMPMEEAEYQRLVKKTQGGWSTCADEREWLAKLHYLRVGLAEGRLDQAAFDERETRLVTGFLKAAIS